jgi:hypothetical protein
MIAPNEHELLQEADDRIAEWRRLIAKQKRRVADLQRDGHNAGGSTTFLRELEASLLSMRQERTTIARRIKRLEPSAPGDRARVRLI